MSNGEFSSTFQYLPWNLEECWVHPVVHSQYSPWNLEECWVHQSVQNQYSPWNLEECQMLSTSSSTHWALLHPPSHQPGKHHHGTNLVGHNIYSAREGIVQSADRWLLTAIYIFVNYYQLLKLQPSKELDKRKKRNFK